MNAEEKRKISNEARMQLQALKTIGKWRNAAVAVSSVGMAILYAGIAGTGTHLFISILGAVIIMAGIGAALVLNLGMKRGKGNVDKMLKIIGSEKHDGSTINMC